MSEIEELKAQPKPIQTKKKSKLSNFLNAGAKEGRSLSRSKARQMKNSSIENNKKFGFFLTKKPGSAQANNFIPKTTGLISPPSNPLSYSTSNEYLQP